MGRYSFLVNTLLLFALVGTLAAAAMLVGVFSGEPGGGAGATSPPPSSTSSLPTQPVASETVPPTAVETPTPTPEPTPPPSPGGTYTVQPGDSLTAIGLKFGVPWQLIAEANDIQGPDYVIQPGQVLTIPVPPEVTPSADTYVVQAGDTITGIALQFNVSPTDLADFNNIADWNSIKVGQVLHIPGPGWTPLPTATD